LPVVVLQLPPVLPVLVVQATSLAPSAQSASY
jgi:hypothetical protein